MNITLTTEMEKLVNERLASSAFGSVEEVILAGLRLLKAHEERVEALRHEFEIGVDDIKEGRFVIYATKDEIENLANEIIKIRR